MSRYLLVFALSALALCSRTHAADETIRGVLEKTARPGACAQITDALGDVYFVVKTDESEKAVAPFVGKNQKVVITGTVEMREGDPAFYFNLKTAEAFVPKVAPADSKKAPAATP
ncbi:MAG TPA: hypothetical protein VEK08_19375 [Planctomycetota bacterium]|nr:hypothetical protein [Planctomycetota bacterium]